LGLDLLIDNKLKPWVLEVNAYPSMNIFQHKSKKDGEEPSEKTDEDICEVDYYVKSRLVTDVVNLARQSR